MNAKELDKYRQVLLALVRRLRGEVADIREAALRATSSHASIGNAESIPGDSGDMSAEQLQLDIEISLHENERLILDHADLALERIKAGTYGNCVNCHRPIGSDRLDALPYTPYCLDCARRLQDQNSANVAAKTT